MRQRHYRIAFYFQTQVNDTSIDHKVTVLHGMTINIFKQSCTVKLHKKTSKSLPLNLPKHTPNTW